jgi:hypothetical protein
LQRVTLYVCIGKRAAQWVASTSACGTRVPVPGGMFRQFPPDALCSMGPGFRNNAAMPMRGRLKYSRDWRNVV